MVEMVIPKRCHKLHIFIIGMILIEFHSNFSIAEKGTCNLTLKGKDYIGMIHSPTSLYPPFIRDSSLPWTCSYIFHGVIGQRIFIQLQQLVIGEFDYGVKRCSGGHMKIWDGIHKPGQYPYHPNILCGQYFPNEIQVVKVSTQPSAEIEFRAKEISDDVTFRLTYKYVNTDEEKEHFPKQLTHHMKLGSNSVCNWTISMEDCNGICEVMSPGYPGIYPPQVECFYLIITQDPSIQLQLTFQGEFKSKPREVHIRETENCRTDYVELFDGESSKRPLIGRFCGKYIPDITASGSKIYMSFFSGIDLPPYGHVGFYGSAIGITKEWHIGGYPIPNTICDWLFEGSAGSVSSPAYWLRKHTKCNYNFTVMPFHHLEIILTVYGLEEACQDKIEVFEENRIVDRVCHNRLQENKLAQLNYNLTGSFVMISYYTSSGQYQSSQDRGFWASFRRIKARQKDDQMVMLNDEETDRVKQTNYTSSAVTPSTILLGLACLLMAVNMSQILRIC